MSTHPRLVTGALLAAYGAFIAFVLLAPIPSLASGVVGGTAGRLADLGLPPALTEPGRVEFVLNAAMFTPAVLLAALTFPHRPWATWVAYAFLGSFAVEAVQALFLPARSAQFVDVVANTLGAVVGVVLSFALGRFLAPRH